MGIAAGEALIQVNAKARMAPLCTEKKFGVYDLHQRARCALPKYGGMWQPIASAPFDSDLELAVIDVSGPHALVFPCRRILGGWMNAETKERLDVHPTHWRRWEAARRDDKAAAG